MEADETFPDPRFEELSRLLIEEELTRSERAELRRILKRSDEARRYLAEILADSTLRDVRVEPLDRGSVKLSS